MDCIGIFVIGCWVGIFVGIICIGMLRNQDYED